MQPVSAQTPHRDAALLRPIENPGRTYYYIVGLLMALILYTGFVYFRQLLYRLGAPGRTPPGPVAPPFPGRPGQEGGRPIPRMAEVITAIVLAIGGLHPIIDLGRPDRMSHLFFNGRLQSPLLWDITSITAYFTASTVYLFIPMIPDIAILRDRGVKPRWLYEFLSWGWQGTEQQHKVLDRAMNILMVVVIPIAVSVHTIISYIFAMTVQPGWHSTIFGPYFVVGAIFSGIAAILVLMIVFRKVFRLEGYLKHIHFNYLSILLLIMSLIWFYFPFSEYLTGYYGHEPNEMRVFWYKFAGDFAPFFWAMITCNFFLPVALLCNSRTRTIPGILIASISVMIGMWLERLIIVGPALAHPPPAVPDGDLHPQPHRMDTVPRRGVGVCPGVHGLRPLLPRDFDLGDPRGAQRKRQGG